MPLLFMTYQQTAIHWGCPCHSLRCPWAAMPEGCPCPGMGHPQPRALFGVLAAVLITHSHSLFGVSLLQHSSPTATVSPGCLCPSVGLPWAAVSRRETSGREYILPGVCLQPCPQQHLSCALYPSIPPNLSLSLHRSSLVCPPVPPAPSACHHFLNISEKRNHVLL